MSDPISTDPRRCEFGGSLYHYPEARDRALCQEWLTAGGLNDPDEVRHSLDTQTPSELAAELLSNWPDDYLTHGAAAAIFADLSEDRRWLEE
jgi:hypothetical protein